MSRTSVLRRLLDRFAARRKPDLVIKDGYLLRWHLLPRNRVVNLYLHHIRHSDDDRALHDHPWWNCSIVLAGEYDEVTPLFRDEPWSAETVTYRRRAGAIVTRKAYQSHRLVINAGQDAWTLFLTGPRVRNWGFWCPLRRWVRWQDFVDPDDRGQVGKGCG